MYLLIKIRLPKSINRLKRAQPSQNKQALVLHCDVILLLPEVNMVLLFWVASTDATHIFVWNWGSNMAAFPVMVPDFYLL